MTKTMPELLAPCGGWDSFLAAVQNGADAVYMGREQFNARRNADNFSKEKFSRALEYAHIRNVNVYLTMNTILADREIKDALNLIEESYTLGIDGVILQDLGLASLVGMEFPDLPLHASTQMTVYNIEGVNMLEEMGFKRVVLARELTLMEIADIIKHTSLDVEVFIHGALCVSYSGQCLMSSMLGGRSGNRGECAQPCRLPYILKDGGNKDVKYHSDKMYSISPKDICTIEILNKIINTGVSSLKIEGRMKSPEYVATVVRIYRKYLDRLLINGEKFTEATVEKKDHRDLMQVFNRGGFSKGYFEGKTGKDMMSYEKPNNQGIYLGKILSLNKASKIIKIRLCEDLSAGDGVEVWSSTGQNFGMTIGKIWAKGRILKEASAQQIVEIVVATRKLKVGDSVYKTSDKKLNTLAKESYAGTPKRKIPIDGQIIIKKGKPLYFEVTDDSGNITRHESTYIPQRAINKAVEKSRVLEQVEKTGSTPFVFRKVHIEMEGDLAVPIGEINNIRRRVLKKLEIVRAGRYPDRRDNQDKKTRANLSRSYTKSKKKLEQGLSISACFYKDIKGLNYEKLTVDRLYIPFDVLLKKSSNEISKIKENTELYAYIPPITKGNYDIMLKSRLESIIAMGIKGVLAGNIGILRYMQIFPEISFVGDHHLNVFNSASIDVLKDKGVEGTTLSPELNIGQIRDIQKDAGFMLEVLAYGRIPLMISEYCAVGCIAGGVSRHTRCSLKCGDSSFQLWDRKGMGFPVFHDGVDCRSIIFNSNVLLLADKIDEIKSCGIDMIRLNFTDETPEEVKNIADLHRHIIGEGSGIQGEYEKTLDEIRERGFTRGHYFRGV